jgi:hypothetical protein
LLRKVAEDIGLQDENLDFLAISDLKKVMNR